MRWFLFLCALFLAAPLPANAGPMLLGLLVGPGTFTIAGLAINSLGFRLLATVALSALARAMQPKPTQPGIRSEYPSGGGTNAQTFMLGRIASAGNKTSPPYSHGSAGGTPNAYLTLVRDFGDMPGTSLNRVMINDEYVTLDTVAHADFGYPILEFRESGTDYGWVKFYDGSQTVADPFMLATFGADPDYPWTADMVGTGVPYGLFTFRFNRERFSQVPKVICEFDGIPLYDPRLDTSVGGTGSHRWADPATWEQTTNPQVHKYNILRGLTLPDGNIWGGEAAEEDLPLSNWFAAMNVCDVVADGEATAQYQAGLEVAVDQAPADIIDELDKACSGQTVEMGGIWKTRTGGPGLPVYYLTDDDIIVTKEQSFDPFPGLEATYNGVQATYPEPDSFWATKDAPPRYNATYETEDQNRRLVAALQLPAVSNSDQVQRLMEAYIKEERRFRRHNIFLPPDAAILEPLDTVSWTSTRNGYVAKEFEVSQIEDHLSNCNQAIAIRERDNADYDWVSGDMLPTSVAPSGRTPPAAQTVPGFALAATTVKDAASVDRRPAVQLSWTSANLDDVRALRWQVRIKASGVAVASGSTHDFDADGVKVSDGILPGVEYEARARLVVDRQTSWTGWLAATTADLKIETVDVASGAISNRYAGYTAAALAITTAWQALRTNTINIDGNDLIVGFSMTAHGMEELEIRVKLDGVVKRTLNTNGGFVYRDFGGGYELAWVWDNLITYSFVLTNGVTDTDVDMVLEARYTTGSNISTPMEIEERNLWSLETKR